MSNRMRRGESEYDYEEESGKKSIVGKLAKIGAYHILKKIVKVPDINYKTDFSEDYHHLSKKRILTYIIYKINK